MNNILIVGAGFAGATISRLLAENGYKILLIDKRNHIGGNAYDYVNSKSERIHKYGPHLFHCNSKDPSLKFLNRFTEWVEYKHKVRAILEQDKTTPLPVNRTTLEDVFNISLSNEKETINFLNSLRLKIINPNNSDELFLASYGEKITNIFFRPYTEKMWGIKATELEVSVGARLPFRTNRNEYYFNDSFQALPKYGYKNLIENIFDHRNINIKLNCLFDKRMQKFYSHSFLCIPIDSYYNYQFGRLPYRSILFENRLMQRDDLPSPVLNFTNNSKYTRMTQWSLFPNSGKTKTNRKTFTYEIPCSMETNPNEYYYPVQTKESKILYQKYSKLSKTDNEITFCGRTGLFKYLDMLPCVLLHMRIAKDFLKVMKNEI